MAKREESTFGSPLRRGNREYGAVTIVVEGARAENCAY